MSLNPITLTVHGEHLPINRWSLLVGLATSVLAVAVCNPLARRWGWRPVPTLVALLGLGMVVALTLPENGVRTSSTATCVPRDLADLIDAAHQVGGDVESLLNVAMLAPFAAAAVLASRRILRPAAAVVSLPAAIELTQTLIPGRQCSTSDYLANVLGGLLAIAAGALLQHQPRLRAWLDEHEPAWPVRRRSEVATPPQEHPPSG